MLPSGEDAADVLVDPERHGYQSTGSLHALLEAAREPGASISTEVRRDLLWRLYVSPEDGADAEPLELAELLGPDSDGRSHELVADLQWALERQRDALVIERLGWPASVPEPGEPDPEPGEQRIVDARLEAEAVWVELQARNARIRLLEAERRWRDELLEANGIDPGSGGPR